MKLVLLSCLFLLVSLQGFTAPKEIIFAVPVGSEKTPSSQELASLIGSALADVGFKINVQPYPLKRSMELVARGEIDSALYDDLSPEIDRSKVVTTSFPIVFGRARIFYRKKDTKFDDGHLKNFKGAITLNNLLVEKIATEKGLNFTETKTITQNLHLLVSGRVDYVISMESTVWGAAANEGLADQIKMSPLMFARVPIYFSMNKEKYGPKFPEIEKALRKRMRDDGPKYKILKDILYKE